jgi:hypothetical protein
MICSLMAALPPARRPACRSTLSQLWRKPDACRSLPDQKTRRLRSCGLCTFYRHEITPEATKREMRIHSLLGKCRTTPLMRFVVEYLCSSARRAGRN